MNLAEDPVLALHLYIVAEQAVVAAAVAGVHHAYGAAHSHSSFYPILCFFHNPEAVAFIQG